MHGWHGMRNGGTVENMERSKGKEGGTRQAGTGRRRCVGISPLLLLLTNTGMCMCLQRPSSARAGPPGSH
jgi:hypothetical protein